MSVVAGCTLFDGVLLAADCRITFPMASSRLYYTDNAQKLFPLTPTTAIGFVGNLNIASSLLQSLSTYPRKRRLDPISLGMWIQRKFQFEYARLTASNAGTLPKVAFIVGSALRGRPNVVERKAIGELLFHIAQGSVKQSWVPAHLVNLLDAPPEYTHIAISGTSKGLLYIMRSPNFGIESYGSLKFAAIGSGESLIEEISDVKGVLLGGELSDDYKWLRRAVQKFLREKDISSVGGLFPVLRVTGKGTEFIGQETWRLDRGKVAERIQLVYENDRWKQQNLDEGKEIVLLHPWEIQSIARDNKFDYLRNL
jgi:hypothetical protein